MSGDSAVTRVGFVGAGNMAKEHLRAFSGIDGVELTGIVSRTQERARTLAEQFGVPIVAHSISDLMERSKPDLLVVAVSVESMFEAAMTVINYPCAILLEKPPALYTEQANALLHHATHERVYVALNRRFFSSTRSALAFLDNDQDHRRFIHVVDQQDMVLATAIGHSEEVVKQWMFANAIHLVDYLAFLGRGRITSVQRIVPWDPANQWIVLAKVEFETGDVGIYEGIWSGPGPWSVSINTQTQRLLMQPLELLHRQVAGSRINEPVPITDLDREWKPGLRLQALNAVAAARREPHSLPGLVDAVTTMDLIQAIFQTN